MSARWHLDLYGQPDPTLVAADFCPACNLVHEDSCANPACDRPHLHGFTDAELRARDERMIIAGRVSAINAVVVDIDAIIAAAEADQ